MDAAIEAKNEAVKKRMEQEAELRHKEEVELEVALQESMKQPKAEAK